MDRCGLGQRAVEPRVTDSRLKYALPRVSSLQA